MQCDSCWSRAKNELSIIEMSDVVYEDELTLAGSHVPFSEKRPLTVGGKLRDTPRTVRFIGK